MSPVSKTLGFLELKSDSGTTFSVTIDLPSRVPDFIIPEAKYNQAMSFSWRPGMRFGADMDGQHYFGEVARVLKDRSGWESLVVKWRNDKGDYVRDKSMPKLSPWEVVPDSSYEDPLMALEANLVPVMDEPHEQREIAGRCLQPSTQAQPTPMPMKLSPMEWRQSQQTLAARVASEVSAEVVIEARKAIFVNRNAQAWMSAKASPNTVVREARAMYALPPGVSTRREDQSTHMAPEGAVRSALAGAMHTPVRHALLAVPPSLRVMPVGYPVVAASARPEGMAGTVAAPRAIVLPTEAAAAAEEEENQLQSVEAPVEAELVEIEPLVEEPGSDENREMESRGEVAGSAADVEEACDRHRGLVEEAGVPVGEDDTPPGEWSAESSPQRPSQSLATPWKATSPPNTPEITSSCKALFVEEGGGSGSSEAEFCTPTSRRSGPPPLDRHTQPSKENPVECSVVSPMVLLPAEQQLID